MEILGSIRDSIWAVAVVCLAVWGWRFLNWIWLRPKKLERCLRKQGFAGNPYRLLTGDMKDIAAMREQAISSPMNFSHDIAPRVIPSINHTFHKYGKNSFMWIGPYPRVHIMDPDQLKAAFSLMHDVQKPSINPLSRLLFDGLTDHEGPKWVKHRKIINPAFHFKQLKDMVPAMCESCTEMIRKWEEVVSKDEYYELDVMPHLGNLAADVISRTAFGSSYEEGKMIFIRLKQLINLVVKATSTVYIPGWRFVPTKSNNIMKKISKELKTLLMDVINKRQRAMMAGEAMHNDLLSILLQSNLKEILEHGNNDVGMSIEDIVDECRVFYLAGQETTAMLLVWTMVLLSSYTRWQDLAREEVLQVFGNNKPDFDGLNRLKIVTMILNEVLRLYPPPALISRLVQNEIKLGKLSFPAGVMLSFPIILIHRDKNLWGDDANEFNPDRFAEGVSKATQNQAGFFPFGWGPRICIGQNFAIIEAKIALSMILQHFSFELSSSYKHAPTSNLTTRPQHGAHIMLLKL
ncbi:cytochrome P450 CYP72A219-like [Cucurbita maxima]|uniref:Cytochrome P450 CYP72A219-like n=1 Tax=Cucurbita maxima TaxID=3661 RepID=A0A6J1IHE1_CUCMA|nr:cytochrome P450 CYP72A219-like [Cucurbita maxima]